MVAPAFGFSFGDIVTAIDLITKAAEALRKTDGVSNQYQQTALELNALVNVIRRVQAFGAPGTDPALVQQIQLCGHICHGPLDSFITKIKRFESSFATQLNQPRPSKTKLRKAKDSITWALGVEQEVSLLKAAISPQLAIIDILLQLDSVERLSATENQNGALKTDIQQLLCRTDQLRSYLTNNVATKSDVSAPIPLLDSLLLSQSAQNQTSVDLTGSVRILSDSINAKFRTQDALLHNLIDQIRILNSASAAFHPQKVDLSRSLSTAPCYSSPGASSYQSVELVISSAFAQVLEAVRARVVEVISMLFCFIPNLKHVLRTTKALYQLPSLLLSDNIHLEDALGRMMSLQYEHFKHWPVLEARLRCAFDGLPGDGKVQRNQYRIVLQRASTDVVLNAENWTQSVFPGSKLQMAILFGQTTEDSSLCPRCQQQCESVKTNHWARCTKCELTYKLPETQRRSYLDTASMTDRARQADLFASHPRRMSKTLPPLQSRVEDAKDIDETFDGDEEDIQYFKRVYLVRRRKLGFQASLHAPLSTHLVNRPTSESGNALQGIQTANATNLENISRSGVTADSNEDLDDHDLELSVTGASSRMQPEAGSQTLHTESSTSPVPQVLRRWPSQPQAPTVPIEALVNPNSRGRSPFERRYYERASEPTPWRITGARSPRPRRPMPPCAD